MYRILIVEDDSTIASNVAAHLEDATEKVVVKSYI